MGGDLPPRPLGKDGKADAAGAPTFITAAWWDEKLKTKLQQIQIVKGWADADGTTHERVYTVAGDDGSALNPEVDSRDLQSRSGQGRPAALLGLEGSALRSQAERLLLRAGARGAGLPLQHPVVPHLDRRRSAVEHAAAATSPRWRTAPMQQKVKADQGAKCCSNQTTSTFLQPIIQERAWTSPIWYEPPMKEGDAPAKKSGK